MAKRPEGRLDYEFRRMGKAIARGEVVMERGKRLEFSGFLSLNGPEIEVSLRRPKGGWPIRGCLDMMLHEARLHDKAVRITIEREGL